MNSLFSPQQLEAIATTTALSPPQLGPGLLEKTTTSQQEFPDWRMPSFFKICKEQGGRTQLPTRSHGTHTPNPFRRPRPQRLRPSCVQTRALKTAKPPQRKCGITGCLRPLHHSWLRQFWQEELVLHYLSRLQRLGGPRPPAQIRF